MPTERFDVVVVGVGGMGSAALYHLARARQARARARALRRAARARLVPRPDTDHPARVLRALRTTCRSCGGPTSSGASSRPRPANSCCTRRASSRAARRSPTACSARAPTTTSRTRLLDRRGARRALSGVSTARRDARSCSSRTAASSSPSAASSRTSTGRSQRGAVRARPRARARVGGHRERRARPHGSRRRRGRAARAHRGRMVAGRRAGCRRARARRPAGARLVPADPPGALRTVTTAGLQPDPRRRALLRLPRVRHPGLQGRPLRASAARAAIPTHLPRADARGRAPAPRVRRALLPGRRRADDRAQDLPLRAVARRALPRSTPTPRASAPSSAPASPATASSSARSIGEILADLAPDGSTRHDIGLFRLDRFG